MPMQRPIEDLLVETKLISPPQLAIAQRDAEMRGRPLAQTLIDLGFVSDRRFAEWVAGVTRLPIVEPLRPDVISEFEGQVPPSIAREYEVVPLDVNADEMTIATTNPLDRSAIDAVQSATGMKIQAVIAIHGQLAEMIARFYPAPPAFDPSETVSVSEVAPFDFGDDTLLRRHSQEFTYSQGDVSLGSETRVLSMPLPPPPTPTAAPPPAAEDNFGGETRVLPMPPPPPPPDESTNPVLDPPAEAKPAETQLDRIERHLTDAVRIIEALQRRVDAIDATLARIVNRER